jgi:hypothetical protein
VWKPFGTKIRISSDGNSPFGTQMGLPENEFFYALKKPFE